MGVCLPYIFSSAGNFAPLSLLHVLDRRPPTRFLFEMVRVGGRQTFSICNYFKLLSELFNYGSAENVRYIYPLIGTGAQMVT